MSSSRSDPFRDRLNSVSVLRPKQETHQAQTCRFLLRIHQAPGSDLSPTEGRTTSRMSSTSSARLGSSPCSSRVVFCPWTWTLSLILEHKNTAAFSTEEVLPEPPRPPDNHQEAPTGFQPVLFFKKKTCSCPPPHQDQEQDSGKAWSQDP